MHPSKNEIREMILKFYLCESTNANDKQQLGG